MPYATELLVIALALAAVYDGLRSLWRPRR